MSEFSITQSLFGLNPQGALDAQQALRDKQDDAYANRLATLDPSQRDVYIASRGGSMAGRGVVDFAKGMMGVDTAPRQVQLAQATQAILRDLQQSGMDPNDHIGVRKELSRRLGAAGFTQEAAMLAQEVGQEEVNTGFKRAQTAAQQANALKDMVTAQNQETPFQQLTKTGKFTPESLALYQKTGSVADLDLADDKYEKVETNDGVYMVNKKDPTDRMRLGDVKTNESTDRWMMNKWANYLKAATDPKTGKVDWNRLSEADRNEAKAIAASSRMFGKEGVLSFFGDLAVNLGVEEQKALAGVLRAENFDKEFTALTKEYLPKSDAKSIAQFQSALAAAGQNGITAATLHNIVKDPAAARYVASAIRYINAILRRESGAAVTEAEWNRYASGYIPLPGDGPEAVAEKERARRIWPQTEIDAFSPAMKNAYKNASSRKEDMTPGAKPADPKKIDKTNPLVAAAYKAKSDGNYAEWYKGLTKDEKAALKSALGVQ